MQSIYKITDKLKKKLEKIAKKIISENLDMTVEENRDFFNNPDGMEHHNPWWHQWGIITHTEMVHRSFIEEVPLYLEKWGILEKIKEHLNKDLDKTPRRNLFVFSIYFHDAGKFKTRKLYINSEGIMYCGFKSHEKASGEIIRDKYLSNKLKEDFLLTGNQIEYIAKCAELHYELGILRDKSKKTVMGYTKEFIESSLFSNSAEEIIKKNSDFKWEIGLFYLADTLGKTDLRLCDENDREEINNVKKKIKRRDLPEDLIKGVIQLPTGIEVVKKYFEICLK